MIEEINSFKALADETRYRLVTLLLTHDFCVGGLARHLGISEAAVSQHLKYLRETGLVKGEKRGYWTFYSMEKEKLQDLAELLSKLAKLQPCSEGVCAKKASNRSDCRKGDGKSCGCHCQCPEKPLLRTNLFLILILLILSFLPGNADGGDRQDNTSVVVKHRAAAQTQEYLPMPGPGKKVPMGGGYYLIYGFDKKPKLGTAIMKVEIFTGDGKKDTSCTVQADTGMPSMGGAHETGERPFVLSKKGVYLLPIDIVMPGDWETRFTVMKAGKVIFRGRYNFNV